MRGWLRYAIAVGQVALAWNSLCDSFAALFWTVLGGGDSGVPLAAWNSLKSDRAQREMLKDAAKAFFLKGGGMRATDKYPTAAADVAWIFSEANKLEDDRNNAVHSPLILHPQGALSLRLGMPSRARVMPATVLENSRALNLAEKDLLAEFRRCRDAALILRNYCRRADWALCHEPQSWPQRPRLPPRPNPSSRNSPPSTPRSRPRQPPASRE
jgi:hypothetical protein